MRRFRSPDRLRRVLLLTLGLGCATAHAVSCELPEQLLSVSINGASRGVQVVRLHQEASGEVQVLLPQELLRPSEQAMSGPRLTCDGQEMFVPAPDVRVRFNQGEQQVSLTLAARQLGGHDLNLQGARHTTAVPPQPSWGVAYGANVYSGYSPQNTFSIDRAQAYLGLGHVRDRLSAYADVIAIRDGQGDMTYEPRALARYAFNADNVITAAWNVDPDVNTPEFHETDFRGVGLEGRRGFQRTAPEWVLELPLDAEVTILLDGLPLSTTMVSAGSLTVRNVQVDKAGTHTLKALITDDNGQREEILDLTQFSFGLPPGALIYSARVGTQRSQWLTAGQIEYGVTPALALQGSALLTPEVQALNASAEYGREAWNTEFGLHYRRTPLDWNLDVSARSRVYLGRWQLSGLILVPTRSIGDGLVNLSATYHVRNWFMNATYVQGFSGNQPLLGASVSHTFSPRLTGTVYGGIGQDGWNAGLQIGYLVNSRLQTSAEAVASNAGTRGLLNVTYTPSPAHTFDLDFSTPAQASLRYRYVRAVDAQLNINTDRVINGYMRGAVNFTSGSAKWQPALAQRALLVQTGIPNLNLQINGQEQVITDASGDALIVNLPAGQLLEVSVDLKTLPITISVQSDREKITPPMLGVHILDWRQNFKVSRWVQFSWTPSELAREADFVTSQGTFPLDDQGHALVPVTSSPLTGTLRTQDATRSCPVSLGVKAEQVSCLSAP